MFCKYWIDSFWYSLPRAEGIFRKELTFVDGFCSPADVCVMCMLLIDGFSIVLVFASLIDEVQQFIPRYIFYVNLCL